MELKKSEKASLESKKTIFLQIGLCFSLALMILVFSISQNEIVIEDISIDETFELVDQMEVTIQDQKIYSPPTARQALSVLTNVINIVDNNTQITQEMEFTDFQDDVQFVSNVTSTEESGRETVGHEEEIFIIVEDMPTFQGGDLSKFRNWVQSRLVYPEIAREMGLQGTVVISFVIERDGTLSNVEILSKTDRTLNEATKTAVLKSPKWTPGKQRNVPARVKFTMPVHFKIQ